jgi:hypothetical protein
MSSVAQSIIRQSPRIHRASLGLVILVGLAAFALRAVAPSPIASAAQPGVQLDTSAEAVAH